MPAESDKGEEGEKGEKEVPGDKRIENTTTPILFISGTASDTNDDMHQLRDLAKQSIYTDFLEVPGGNKNDTWRVGGKNYLLSIDNFIIKTRPIVNIPLPSAPTTSTSTNTTASVGTTSTSTTVAGTTVSRSTNTTSTTSGVST